jgi:iron complex outermembrane receptor protein
MMKSESTGSKLNRRGMTGGALLSAIISGFGVGTSIAAERQAESGTAMESLEEIVVTARKREEKLQDVPIAITAFSEDSLREKSITNGWDIQKASPSLIATSSGQRDTLTYSMRGQSPAFFVPASSAVVYFAEVPISSNQATAPFFDLESVQVLSGPQGTLFGRNSTGGAVLFTPRKPRADFDAYIKASFGNLGYQEYEGALNLPLGSNKLALRVAGNVVRRDGFTHDLTFNQDQDNKHEEDWRIGLLFNPTDWLENYLLYDGRKTQTNGTGFILHDVSGAAPAVLFQALQNQQAFGIRTVATTPGPLGLPASSKSDGWGLSNTTNLTFGAVTVKNILGYRRAEGILTNTFDQDNTPLAIIGTLPIVPVPVDGFGGDFPNGTKAFTEELQVLGKSFDDKLDWIVGGFYSDTKTELNSKFYSTTYSDAPPPIDAFPVDLAPLSKGKDTSRAVFAQATYSLSSLLEGLSVTAGYRYSWDEIEATFGTVTAGRTFFLPTPGCLAPSPALPIAGCSQFLSVDSSSPTWNFTLDYKVTSDTLVYLAHRHGYKAAGINLSALPPQGAPYQFYSPEEIDDIEFGLKTDWSAGDVHGRFDLAVYSSWYQDIQRSAQLYGPGTFAAVNAAKATIKGVELQATLVPLRDLELSLSYAYTDASYSEFTFPTSGADLSGRPFGFVPENKVNLSARYDVQLGDDRGTISPSFNLSWQDQFFYSDDTVAFPQAIVPSHALLDARIDWMHVLGSDLSVALFGRNLADKDYILNGNHDIANIGRVFYGEPRTCGVELRYQFGGAKR